MLTVACSTKFKWGTLWKDIALALGIAVGTIGLIWALASFGEFVSSYGSTVYNVIVGVAITIAIFGLSIAILVIAFARYFVSARGLRKVLVRVLIPISVIGAYLLVLDLCPMDSTVAGVVTIPYFVVLRAFNTHYQLKGLRLLCDKCEKRAHYDLEEQTCKHAIALLGIQGAHKGLTDFYRRLAFADEMQQKMPEATMAYKEVIERDREYDKDELANDLGALGYLYDQIESYGEADKCYEESERIFTAEAKFDPNKYIMMNRGRWLRLAKLMTHADVKKAFPYMSYALKPTDCRKIRDLKDIVCMHPLLSDLRLPISFSNGVYSAEPVVYVDADAFRNAIKDVDRKEFLKIFPSAEYLYPGGRSSEIVRASLPDKPLPGTFLSPQTPRELYGRAYVLVSKSQLSRLESLCHCKIPLEMKRIS